MVIFLIFVGLSKAFGQEKGVSEEKANSVLEEITGLSIDDISEYYTSQSGGRITLNYFTKYFQSSQAVCRRSKFRIFTNIDGGNKVTSHEFMGYYFALGTCQEEMDWHGMGTVHFNDKFLIYMLDKTEEWLRDEAIDQEFKAAQIDGHLPLFENLNYIELIPDESESDSIIKFSFFKLIENSESALTYLRSFIIFQVKNNGKLTPLKYEENVAIGHKIQK